ARCPIGVHDVFCQLARKAPGAAHSGESPFRPAPREGIGPQQHRQLPGFRDAEESNILEPECLQMHVPRRARKHLFWLPIPWCTEDEPTLGCESSTQEDSLPEGGLLELRQGGANDRLPTEVKKSTEEERGPCKGNEKPKTLREGRLPELAANGRMGSLEKLQ